MTPSLREIAVIPTAVVLVALLLWSQYADQPAPVTEQNTSSTAPDFAAFTSVAEKKSTFFAFMLPKVRAANQKVSEERSRMLALLHRQEETGSLRPSDVAWLQALAVRYRVKGDPLTSDVAREILEKRVDTLPASLALAQAANESAWGTARFARNGNNYFGIWCWTEDCGLVPEKRDEGARHEVTRFERAQQSVDYYLLTLNSHPAYTLLRDIREAQRKLGVPARGYDLAAGLLNYSERREAYIDEIREMIEYNNLQRYTRLNYDI